MRIFITSTPDELERHRMAACEVANELGFQPIVRDPAARRGIDPVTACSRQVASSDFLLAIVGWRRGSTPTPELGGDGLRPWTFWEVKSAFDHGKPVAVLMASESWRPELRYEGLKTHSMMRDFRGELDQLAVFFEEESACSNSLNDFGELVRHQIERAQRILRDSAEPSSSQFSDSKGTRLRRWPATKLPERPYPVLLPYTHPNLMAGRERELDELRQQLRLPVPILGLYGLSGTGKSSLLAAGLVPALRAEGQPVAFDRHPCEAGIVARLLSDLLVSKELDIADEDTCGFVDRLLFTRHLAGGATPVLLLDQFEDLLRKPERRSAGERRSRAVIGALLAASVQRQPGLEGPPCRWLLAYRQEFHGEVFQWLGNVLSDARAEDREATKTLPHNLAGPERFTAWPLKPLGTPAPGSDNPTKQAMRLFQAAIERPLELTVTSIDKQKRGSPVTRRQIGQTVYPWQFAPGHAKRLALAFGEARAARPTAPLAPELQVVLAHLLKVAERSRPEASHSHQTLIVEVPEKPGELIDLALEEHLCQALDFAFPTSSSHDAARIGDARIARTRALLALRELADVRRRRDEGLPADLLAHVIGPEGHTPIQRTAEGRKFLEKLATPQTRLVVLEQRWGEWIYMLPHDRLADVIVRITDEEGWYAKLGIDIKFLSLRRFVALRSELFESGELDHATEVASDSFRIIERHADALLWGEGRKHWWAACQERRKLDRRRVLMRQGIALIVIWLVTFGAWYWADRRTKQRAIIQQVAVGEPEAAFTTLAHLTARADTDTEELLAQLRHRKNPLDVLERGVGGVDEGSRGAAVLRVAELALPLVEETPGDPVLIASMAWAIDFFAAQEPALTNRVRSLRNQVLSTLRQSRPPPSHPGPEDPDWADIPDGAFWIGTGLDKGRNDNEMLDERPQHKVTISAFRLLTHEVTNAEYRRLVPKHNGQANLPAVGMNWYEAYTYAAWLGGRLPTEAEWEYAAQAGCSYAYCRQDGSKASLDEVAWWIGNAIDPISSEPAARPIKQLEPNPWGLFDIYGNVQEWTSDWYAGYSDKPQTDPAGPGNSPLNLRTARGGNSWYTAKWVMAASREGMRGTAAFHGVGFRVALPAYLSQVLTSPGRHHERTF